MGPHIHRADVRDRGATPPPPVLEPKPANGSTGAHKIPEMVQLDEGLSPLAANRLITEWYDKVDRILTEYMGDPPLPTWARFAKHASYNAGVQLRNLTEGKQAIDSVLTGVYHLGRTVAMPSPWGLVQFIKLMPARMNEYMDIFRYPGLADRAIGIGYANSGIPEDTISEIADCTRENSFLSRLKQAALCIRYSFRLLKGLAKVENEMERLSAAVSQSNRDIYKFMAPRINRFLQEELGENSTYTEPLDDDQSAMFLNRALEMYKEAREMSDLARKETDPQERRRILRNRVAHVAKANIFATFGEQLHRVQPHFESVGRFLALVTPFLQFPFGEKRKAGAVNSSRKNWGNIYHRMGINADRAPVNPKSVTPDRFPPLLQRSDPRYQGTISQILIAGTKSRKFAESLEECPPEISEAVDHYADED